MANPFARAALGRNKQMREISEKIDKVFVRIDEQERYMDVYKPRNFNETLLATGQDYYTNFVSSDNGVADKLGTGEALYRFHYVRGTSNWFSDNYGLGFRIVNHAYAERFVSTYAKYCFQEINANVINGTTKTTNVVSKDKMINYIQNALLYRKVLVRLKLFPEYNKLEKIYYDWQLDFDNNPIITKDGFYIKEIYDENLGKYQWVLLNEKDLSVYTGNYDDKFKKIKEYVDNLNKINFECPFADYVFEVPFEIDVVRKAMGICHKLDKANSKLNWESDIGSTMIILPNGMVRGYKEGKQLFRTMDLPSTDSTTESIKPLIVKASGGIEDAIREITHLKDELSETTHINFLSDVSTEQTATEFKGREKPFIQSINEINNTFFPVIKKMYEQVSSFYRINVDALELSEFELHTEQQTLSIANGISQISAFPDPVVQAEVVGMFLNYSQKQKDELAKRLQEADDKLANAFASSADEGY